MVNASTVNIKNQRLLWHVILCLSVLLILFCGSKSFANDCFEGDLGDKLKGECTYPQGADGNKDPKIDGSGNCFFGCCGVCDVGTGWDSWLNPQVQVLYMPFSWSSTPWGLPVYDKIIDLQKCKWIAGVRFCARPTKPAAVGQSASDNYGNGTDRPKICAYEDSCDGMDPPDGNCAAHSDEGPYHQNTPNNEAMSISKAATIGAAVLGGAAIATGPVALLAAGIGAGIGAGIAAIKAHFNHIVITNVGCIDRKIGPMPPAWNNNAWFKNNIPDPVFTEDATSTFESPKFIMKWCTESSSSDKQVICRPSSHDRTYTLNPQAVCATCDENSIPALSLTDLSVATTDKAYYRDCKTIGVAPFQRKYCAVISKEQPEKVQITVTGFFGNAGDNAETIVLRSPQLKRPGYIPVPTLQQSADSRPDAVKIDLTLRGKTITLEEDPWLALDTPRNSKKSTALVTFGQPVALSESNSTPWKTSGYLHQVRFSIARPCVPGFIEKATTASIAAAAAGTLAKSVPVGTEYCTKFSKAFVCIDGYDTAPFTFASKESGFSLQDVPNILKVKNIAFSNDNASANPEPSNATTKQQVQFTKNVYVASSDTGVYDVRPLSALESGLCIDLGTAPEEYTTPGNHTYTVPEYCTEVAATLWGGGGAGKFVVNQTGVSNDGTGGSAVLTYGTIPLEPEVSYSVAVNVGQGALTMGGAGGSTSITINNENAIAGGASAWNRGTFATASAGLAGRFFYNEGTDGVVTTNTVAAGAAAVGSTAQPASECAAGNEGTYQAPFGGGGCSKDDGGGAWGKGGNGKVSLSCTKHQIVIKAVNETFNTPGNATFEVPEDCTSIVAEVWGAGAAGRARDDYDGDCNEQSAGGEGGYGKWKLPIPQSGSRTLSIVVGDGGSSRTGGSSSVTLASNRAVLASGGVNNVGGGTAVVWDGNIPITTRNGINGGCSGDKDSGPSYGANVAGANWWISGDSCYQNVDPTSASQNPKYYGAGGCHCDNCNGNEPWGYGGDGQVKITCLVKQE